MAEDSTIAVPLPASLVKAAEARAEQEGETLHQALVRVLDTWIKLPRAPGSETNGSRETLPSSTDNHRTTALVFFDRLQKHLKDIPEEGWENIPCDGSRDPDRYLYGRR